MYCVYCHTNNANGKKYIGITSQKPTRRWANGNGYKYNAHFYNAILQNGWENFSHEIMFDNLSAAEASSVEIMLIKALKTADPKYGYNLSLGGEHNEGGITEETRKKLSYSSSHISEETRQKHRTNMTKRMEQKEFREKARLGASKYAKENKEKITELFSHYWHNSPSEDCRKKMSLAHQRSVVCVETGETFCSISTAASSLGLSRTGVENVLNGRSVTAGGKHFIYADGNNEKVRESKKKGRPVVCIETGKVFSCVKEAADIFGTCEANIKHCASGRYRHAKGFTFAYVNG